MAALAAIAITAAIESLWWLASRAPVMSAVSPGSGAPADSAATSRNSSG
jgi:hypothetical protein